ncbi:translationally controlled tumor-associated [Histomonas meleagridis]|uniref:translationally controlled tumor-associated n=1 Tax=Histomonas meleagridis TaxID=135588 RepID=UPI0035597CFE|nr:translationally controlled tumor-associated [Histomonas meleagridis]KAH0793944.1 translationally controlled tumor-associated [Histomonas meleagridis]KAH0806220.1 translationally controlled tumor-associated [Histomonas meleagridis]KAH0806665.1 translationally controlled tumor-associated [Histomonas meleagridis]
MRLYESPVNHDEMINDAYPSKPNEEAGCLVFESRYIDKLADEEDPNSKYQVIDIVENFNLQPYDMKKAAFMGWAKQFMPMRKKQLEQSNPGAVDTFMANAKKFVSFIAKHFADFEVYMGQSGDPDDYLMFAREEDGKMVFYFLELACDNFKC